jgi:threonine/homoserine/homoserine lactone efflux protein
MLAAAFVIGVAVAVPPGAVIIAGSQRAITRGFWDAFNFFIGVLAADAVYALLVYFGLSTVFKDSVAFRLVLWILGGAWLCWLGISAIRTRVEFSTVMDTSIKQTRWAVIRNGLLITLFNPLTIVSWIALAGNFFETVWRPDWPMKESVGLLAILAMLVGTQTWALGVVGILSVIRRMISPRILHWASVLSGVFLILYGLNGWWSAVNLLLFKKT